MSNFNIRNITIEDLTKINEIVNFYIEQTNFSLATETQTIEDTENWYEAHGDIYPILVIEDKKEVVGYACLSKFRAPSGYNKTAEVSIYLKPVFKRLGIGTLLMQELLDKAKEMGFHNLMSVVISENIASIEFHKKFGFSVVGTIKEAGYKNERFFDVVYMSKILV